VSRPSRRRRDPALLRARYRTLFFLLLTVLALSLGYRAAAVPALAGALIGVYSVRVARIRPIELAHTFVVLDWLLLGLALALSGGAESWLLGALPLLAMGQLAGAPRSEWPFLVGPALGLVVVLAIADPSLGGSRAGGVAKVAVLIAGGCVAATRLRRRPAARRRQPRAPRVDVSTGLSTAACLPSFLEGGMAAALAEHRPLSIVYVRLDHYNDSRSFLGNEGSEKLVRGVARRAERRLSPDGRAFRVRPDGLVLVLPGLSLAEARRTAADLAREVSGNLIAGRRQTLSTGASSFPTVRGMEDLLTAARDEALPAAAPTEVAGTVTPLAVAQ
jgi:GGDEF domain-containing protein